jgi:hypothetical protein
VNAILGSPYTIVKERAVVDINRWRVLLQEERSAITGRQERNDHAYVLRKIKYGDNGQQENHSRYSK